MGYLYGVSVYLTQSNVEREYKEMDAEKLRRKLIEFHREAADILSQGFLVQANCYGRCKVRIEVAQKIILGENE